MKYLKINWLSLDAIDIFAINENGYTKISIDPKNTCIENHKCDWINEDNHYSEKNGYVEISESEFKEMYLQAQNQLTLQYHDLFSAKENEFIKN